MRRKILCNIVILALCAIELQAQNDSTSVGKSSIYGGTQIKLDILMPAIVAGTSKGALLNFEIASNVRLAQRFYPTFELGYTGGKTSRGDSLYYAGQGGFFRVGADICPLKKHPERPHALLVGIRLGAAVQDCQQVMHEAEQFKGVRGDCWGEIVAGCQVEIAQVGKTAFYMGWMGRFKALFTRTLTAEVKATLAADVVDISPYMPIYIPGYGKRENIGWGANYYLGWRF